MRCKNLRDRLDEIWAGEIPATMLEHLSRCPECARYAREVRMVQSGFVALAKEPVPEPSLGFAERLVRRLEEAKGWATQGESYERVGRRFVYATLLVTLILLLALMLPPSGPIRGVTTSDLLMSEPDTASLRADPIGTESWRELPDVTPAPAPMEKREGVR